MVCHQIPWTSTFKIGNPSSWWQARWVSLDAWLCIRQEPCDVWYFVSLQRRMATIGGCWCLETTNLQPQLPATWRLQRRWQFLTALQSWWVTWDSWDSWDSAALMCPVTLEALLASTLNRCKLSPCRAKWGAQGLPGGLVPLSRKLCYHFLEFEEIHGKWNKTLKNLNFYLPH